MSQLARVLTACLASGLVMVGGGPAALGQAPAVKSGSGNRTRGPNLVTPK